MRMVGKVWRFALLALAFVTLCAGVTLGQHREAKAEDPTYKVTVTDVKPGSTYKAYKVLDVTYSGSNYAYTINSSNPFYSAVSSSGLFTLEKIGSDASGNIYSVALKSTVTDVSSLAAALRDVANKPSPAATQQAGESATSVVLDVTASGAGYYFVDTTTGTICSLDTTNPNASVRDKNSKPSIVKHVRESGVNNGDYGFVQQNDAKIGDTVEFRTKITVTQGATGYVVHDKLASGLTLDEGSLRVGLEPDPATAVTTAEVPVPEFQNGFEFKTTGLDDGCSFHIVLHDDLHSAFLNEAPGYTSRDLYFFYTAKLNKDAVVGATGNQNETWLHYGGGTSVTEKSITKTYTWPLKVVKYTGNDVTKNPLAGATFTLTKAKETSSTWTADGSPLTYLKQGNTTNYTLSNEAGAVSSVTTDATGAFTFNGLDSGTYLLTETKAPDGYNKIADPIRVTIGVNDVTATTYTPGYQISSTSGGTNSNSGTISLGTDAANTQGTVYVQNRTGAELPSAGGMGTTILYVVGGVLVVGAATALVAKRRAHKA